MGDVIGFRGPYGNWFPIDRMEGKNLLFVAGGIGLAPVRSVIWNCLDLRDRFKKVTIVYGARTVDDLVYKEELNLWRETADVETLYTVDPGGETPEWQGKVGFVPTVLEAMDPAGDNTIVVTCGPPIMIKTCIQVLFKLGFSPEKIISSLEMRMKCGIGKCGRCNIGHKYVCKDGPVFTYAELQELSNQY